ncbi:MAG: restriction endonuclease subunit S [Lactobacillus delbrueckii]|jgi:type I restriction enzyme S subunit|nr:restriction endonuclease subunit S [Lactobacillus delbrueckii]
MTSKKVMLKQIGKIVTGKTPATDNLNFWNGEILFISPTDLHVNMWVKDTQRKITERGLNSIRTNAISGLSILVGCIGWDMGNVAIVNGTCATNQQINSITEIKTELVNPYYVYYWLKNKKDYLFRISNVTRTPILKKSLFEEVEINLPDKQYQDRIVKLLKNIDDTIENNVAIIDKLRLVVKTIYDYWFLQFEFPNEEGKPYKSSGGKMVWNEELQRDIPEGWGSAKLKDVIVENPKSKIKVGDVKNIGEVPFFTSGAEILSTNDSIVSGLNCYLNTGGNADVKYYYGEASYSTDTWCITAEDGMKYILPFILDKIKPSMDKVFFQGTGLRHLQKNLLREYRLCIPDNDVLKKFEKIARDIFVQQHNLLAENRKLESLKEFLLPLLMNGQVTVGE